VLGTKEFVEEKGIELEGNTGAMLGPDWGTWGLIQRRFQQKIC